MKNTRKIVFHLQTNTVGTDKWEFWIVPEDLSENSIEELADGLAFNNAEMYSIYPPSWDDSDEDSDEMGDDNIGGIWYNYESEKHDMYRVGSDRSWNIY